MTLAIDFGTSNTVITRWNPVTEQPEVVKLPSLVWQAGQNAPVIPSLVYVENAAQAQVVVGQAVRDRGYDIKNDPRFFSGFKRGIGADIQGFLPQLDGQSLSFEQVGEWFLTAVLQGVKQVPLPVESVILTVPVDSFETYRLWLGNVFQQQAVEQVRLLDEPTAAALGYGLAASELLLVIDFGGGTLDMSLVRLDAQTAKRPIGFILKWGANTFAEQSGQKVKTAQVLAKAGQTLGGGDIDRWLVDYFDRDRGLPQNALTLRLAEKLKIQLSLQQEAQEAYFDEETLDTYELSLDRPTFEAILTEQQFFSTLDATLSQVMQQARRKGINAPDIDAVLLVGGTVQIPAVQTWVRQSFEEKKIRCDKPLTAIAEGALQLERGMEVKDFLYHSYGIRYWDRRRNCHSWHPIINTGQPYPMSNPVELTLGASLENQPSIELVIGELGAETGGVEVFFDGDRLVTRKSSGDRTVKPLNDSDTGRSIARLDPPGHPGSDRVRVSFQVDGDRFLRMTVEDILTNRVLLQDCPVVQLS